MKKSTPKPLPPLELLNSLFTVDKTSPSGLRRKKATTRSLPEGSPAGCKNKNGYWVVSIKTDKLRQYYCHRIVFYMRTGTDPLNSHIDHVNGKPDQNVDNLRLASHSKNQANKKKQKYRGNKPTSSRYKGVSWKKTHKKWECYITVNKKRHRIGNFNTEKEAAQAYNKAAIEYFGEFARLNAIDD